MTKEERDILAKKVDEYDKLEMLKKRINNSLMRIDKYSKSKGNSVYISINQYDIYLPIELQDDVIYSILTCITEAHKSICKEQENIK